MHRLSKLALAAAALGLSASAAQAQTFTYTTTQTKAVNTGTPIPGGTPIAGIYQTGTQVITMADGKKVTDTFTCIGTTQPPRDSVFQFSSVCDSSGPNGDTSSVWGCNTVNAERNEISCVGGVIGKSGAYTGRRGTMTFHGVGGSGSGTGQWYN